MAISTLSTWLPTIDSFGAHWQQCLTAAAPKVILIRLPDNTTVTRAQFLAKRDALQAQQITVQSRLNDQLIARGDIEIQKTALLEKFNLFTGTMDGFYQNTKFYAARPVAPGLTYGQLTFSLPLFDAMTLWEKLNAGPAPAGVTLPLLLPDDDETAQGTFASMISALQFAYREERNRAQDVLLARSDRDGIQDYEYEVMKAYRESVPTLMAEFPNLVATIPRLTPLPGHTPAAVDATVVFEAPEGFKVVYDASTDPALESYQLRGNVGDDYSDTDAVILGTNAPGAPREFVKTGLLNQPGAKMALKLFVITNTGNEAGSVPMIVQRPLAQAA